MIYATPKATIIYCCGNPAYTEQFTVVFAIHVYLNSTFYNIYEKCSTMKNILVTQTYISVKPLLTKVGYCLLWVADKPIKILNIEQNSVPVSNINRDFQNIAINCHQTDIDMISLSSSQFEMT